LYSIDVLERRLIDRKKNDPSEIKERVMISPNSKLTIFDCPSLMDSTLKDEDKNWGRILLI
jgi:ribose 1,5-bisphosphokinase PhnN